MPELTKPLAADMPEPARRDVAPERGQALLIALTMFGRRVGTGLGGAIGDQELAHNIPMLTLCALALYGPQRPRDLLGPTHLTSGALTKWLDRLEELGLIKRTYGTVRGDRRGAIVELTDRGSAMATLIGATIEAGFDEVRQFRDQLTELIGD